MPTHCWASLSFLPAHPAALTGASGYSFDLWMRIIKHLVHLLRALEFAKHFRIFHVILVLSPT